VQSNDSNPQQESEPDLEPEPEPEPEPGIQDDEWGTPSTKPQRKKYSSSPPLKIEYAKSIYILSPYERGWSHFRGLRFAGDEATISPSPDLLAHAKIYVFATLYLVDALREQCLKSLHRDLSNLTLNGRTITNVLDLLEYTYDHTGRQEPGGRCSLRMLVIHYISCEARTLVENTRFRYILDDHGEMASDLVARLVEFTG
jgi:hypothetical protein